jgi:hypothetical protein
MSKRKVVHVIPDRNGGWIVKQEGVKTPLNHFETKDPAIEFGKEEAKAADLGQIKIHGKDNLIQTEYTYGKDPRRTKG